MRYARIFTLAVITASFLLAAYFYPWMPEKVASHWDAGGNVNGYMPAFWGLFIMPIISLALFLLFLALPLLDPLRKNIEKFRNYFEWFIAVLVSFMFYMLLLVLGWNLGLRFNMMQMMVPAFAIMIYFCGVMMGKAKRNWFIGIRTPWTMSSDKVWGRTHALGARLFKAAAVVSLAGLLFPDYAIWLLAAPVLLVSIYTLVYSYVKYRALA
ncbi:MAG TPA: SdpI family protein [Nanoarchaeota archaeon]|nr:SdpI family protein [Nanoarchaeota archaeon]